MSDILSHLTSPAGARHNERRIGRGPGCGKGKTSGRGQKGQKARSGGNINKLHFQGGQTPLQRRLPKRGFRVPFPSATAEVNVSALDRFDDGTVVDRALLREHRLIGPKTDRIKILGGGELAKKLKVHADLFSKSALEKIEKAGGQAIVVEAPAKQESN